MTRYIFLLNFSVIFLHAAECRDPLGMQSGEIFDSAITASSSFDYSLVGPQHARLHEESGGGAWCPKSIINNSSYEYLEVELGKMSVVTMVEIQGRFGNGQGQEFTEEFRLEYQRVDDVTWLRFKNDTGEELFRGNVNTYLAVMRQISPPIIGRRIRFIPYSKKPRTVCMRVEIYGCQWEGCPAGLYGADCRVNCSANCAEKDRSGAPICRFRDGACNFCDNGWYGDKCDVPCNKNCLMSDGVHACHQQDGTCESCKGDKYGPSCNLDCAQNCLDCEKVDGYCLSCQPGYHGNFCDGKCNENCGIADDSDVKVGLCNRNTSLCLHGCVDGWYNDTCLDKCNSKCQGEKCNMDDGKCSQGCVSGYRGDFCDLPANGVTVVGFTATFGRERHLVNIGESEIIVFDSVTSNVGLRYNMATGIFRAPVSGVYVFNVGIVVGPLKLADLLIIQAPESGSTKVDRGHVLADSSNVNKRSMGSRTIVLNLSLGDHVWVRNGLSATIELHGNGLSSFSGYLLGPISP